METSLDAMFAAMPTESSITPFDNDRSCGLLIRWRETGTGFGELTIACRKDTGEWHVDTEEMGTQSVARILMRLVGTIVINDSEPTSEAVAVTATKEKTRRGE